jgi:citrate synthase
MLEDKKKVPGFGHRVYRTEDPRARFLRQMSQQLGERAGAPLWYQLTRKVEDVVTGQKRIYPNVDLYSSSVYRYMGIPVDLYTATFAVSRITGWTAHVFEQYTDNRLIRPLSDYTGPMDRTYVPIDRRG